MGDLTQGPDTVDLIDLDEALERLRETRPRRCQVVEMRFFAGMTEAQISKVLGVSKRTVEDDWALARTWLHRELGRREGG